MAGLHSGPYSASHRVEAIKQEILKRLRVGPVSQYELCHHMFLTDDKGRTLAKTRKLSSASIDITLVELTHRGLIACDETGWSREHTGRDQGKGIVYTLTDLGREAVGIEESVALQKVEKVAMSVLGGDNPMVDIIMNKMREHESQRKAR